MFCWHYRHVREKIGGVVAGVSFLIELKDLNGRAKLGNAKVSTVITY